jgi:hypothetical protein
MASTFAFKFNLYRYIKQKLSDFASKENIASPAKTSAPMMEKAVAAAGGGAGGGGTGVMAGAGAAKPPLAKAIYSDATAEIADIDSRLLALQNFLRDAKGAA